MQVIRADMALILLRPKLDKFKTQGILSSAVDLSLLTISGAAPIVTPAFLQIPVGRNTFSAQCQTNYPSPKTLPL